MQLGAVPINLATESCLVIGVMKKRYLKKRFVKAVMIQDGISVSDGT